MEVELLSSTVCMTTSVRKGVKYYCIAGNEFAGIVSSVHPITGTVTKNSKIGRLHELGTTTDIKKAKNFIRECKKYSTVKVNVKRSEVV
jgi:hypothetical protein